MLIHAKPYGQLGNQLRLFARLLAFSHEHDITLCYPSFLEYADYFESWRGNWLCRFPLPSQRREGFHQSRKFSRWLLHQSGKVVHRICPSSRKTGAIFLPEGEVLDMGSSDFIAAAKQKILFLRGFQFRDVPALTQHTTSVCQLFRPTAEHRRNVAEHIAAARADCDTLVGIHVRHGDYRTYQGGKYYFTFEQYRSFLDQIAGLLTNQKVKFLICSQEIISSDTWQPHRVVPGSGQFVEDMYALAECDIIFGPPSTFSGWASFYGRKPLLSMHSSSDEISLDRFVVARG